MDTLAYAIKHRWPTFFQWVASAAERLTSIRFKRRVVKALGQGLITGSVSGHKALIRPLEPKDTSELEQFLNTLPEEHLSYFRPHRFDHERLESVLRSNAYMNYGLYVESGLAGYALLKLSPSGAAYIGLLTHPNQSGLGLGTFLVSYLYWQASVAGLKARSTISQHNPASLRSHQAVAEFTVIAVLPNDYMLIEMPQGNPRQPSLNH